MASSLPIIQFDYDFSPVSQKTRLLLSLAEIQYRSSIQPPLLPRPDLLKLGITYRRIPLLAIGKDIYCDSSLIINVALRNVNGSTKVKTSKHDPLFEAWGRATSQAGIRTIPASALNPKLLDDRKDFMPLLSRDDFSSLKLSAIAELRNRLVYIENLLDDTFLGGNDPGVADVHVLSPIRSVLFGMAALQHQPGFGKEDLPKIWNALEALPPPKPKTIENKEAITTILNSDYFEAGIDVMDDEPLQLAKGAEVTVETNDSTPGAHPQIGRLIGSSIHEVVLALDSGIHLHFPREGYIVRPR